LRRKRKYIIIKDNKERYMGIIGDFIQKRWIKKAFGKYLDKKMIEEIIDNNNLSIKHFERQECGYIIIEIAQNNYFEEIMDKVITFSMKNNFLVDIFGTILYLCTYESSWNKNVNILKNISNFLENFPEKKNKNIRGLYGIENAIIGNFGSNQRMKYMALINEYYKKLIRINEIEYGKIVEYKK
jgi:hypothetical protein